MTEFESIAIILGEADGEVVEVLEELMRSRLCLRLGVDSLPAEFSSVLVDATCKAYRRVYFEGIKSENVGGLSVTFFDDLLSEYDREISSYKRKNNAAVRFL